MQFLKTLAELATEKIQLQIAITVEKDISIVSVIPKVKDKLWTPFVLRGTPDELDQEFEDNIENFKLGLGIISNASTYAEQVQKEAAASVKTAVKTATPTAKPAATKTVTPPPKPAPKVEAPKPQPPKPPAPKPAPVKKAPVQEVSDDDDFQSLFNS